MNAARSTENLVRASLLLVAAALLIWTASASADTFTFSALPGPGVSHATPGSTIGWGYSITNNSATDWLVVYDLTAGNFPGTTPSPYFFDFPSIAPGSSRIVPYNPFSPYGYSYLAQNGLAHAVLKSSLQPGDQSIQCTGALSGNHRSKRAGGHGLLRKFCDHCGMVLG